MVVSMIKCSHITSEAFKENHIYRKSGNLITSRGIEELPHNYGCFGITPWNRSLILYPRILRDLHYSLSSTCQCKFQSKENIHSLQDQLFEHPLPVLHKEVSKKNSNSHLNKLTYKCIAKGGLKNEKSLLFQKDHNL